MKRIVSGGTGLIGTQLIDHWLLEGYNITVIGRSKEKIEKIFQNRVEAVEWQSLQPEVFKNAEIVVNLAGASIGDKNWSEGVKQEIIKSRISTTKKIVNLLTTLNYDAPPLFNASAVGIYGSQREVGHGLPSQLDESTPIDWNNAPDFLSYVGREWEKATFPAKEKQIRVINLRFGVVLTKQGGALPKIVKPFNFFLGGPLGGGKQPFSWVAIDDLIRAIDFLLEEKQISGPVNIVSPGCITQHELSKVIGKIIKKPSFIHTPAFLLKLLFGQMGDELLLRGQYVYPKKLLEAGFQFLFPNIESALIHILDPLFENTQA